MRLDEVNKQFIKSGPQVQLVISATYFDKFSALQFVFHANMTLYKSSSINSSSGGSSGSSGSGGGGAGGGGAGSSNAAGRPRSKSFYLITTNSQYLRRR